MVELLYSPGSQSKTHLGIQGVHRHMALQNIKGVKMFLKVIGDNANESLINMEMVREVMVVDYGDELVSVVLGVGKEEIRVDVERVEWDAWRSTFVIHGRKPNAPQ